MTIQYFDDLLKETLKYLYEHWYEENVGIVSCCLADKNNKAFATSTRDGKNWKHAERNAYEKYQTLYGQPTSDSVFVVTLSPCLKNLKYRGQSSCSELMKKIGVARTHFGVLDTMHASSLADYKNYGIDASVTKNASLASMCENLMAIFSDYDSRINTDLLGIKKELGSNFFSKITILDERIKSAAHNVRV